MNVHAHMRERDRQTEGERRGGRKLVIASGLADKRFLKNNKIIPYNQRGDGLPSSQNSSRASPIHHLNFSKQQVPTNEIPVIFGLMYKAQER